MGKTTKIAGLSAGIALSDAARLLVAARLADVRRYVELVRRDRGDEEVHDLRVSLRRLRAACDLAGDPLEGPKREAKRLQDALGTVRDVQVQLAWLGEALLGAGGEEQEAVARLIALRTNDLREREPDLLAALARWARAEPELLGGLEEVAPRGKFAGRRHRRRLRRRLERLERRMEDAAGSLAPDVVHALRIAAKKLRYEVELAAPGLDGAASTLLDALEPLQDILGELHDADVRLAFLAGAAGRSAGAGIEPLRLREIARRGQLAHDLAVHLERWREKSLAREMRRALKG